MKVFLQFLIVVFWMILCGALLTAFGVGTHLLLHHLFGVEDDKIARYITCIAFVVAWFVAINRKEARNRKGSFG